MRTLKKLDKKSRELDKTIAYRLGNGDSFGITTNENIHKQLMDLKLNEQQLDEKLLKLKHNEQQFDE
ncbi:unnamed protein product [Arabidopsis halleri]